MKQTALDDDDMASQVAELIAHKRRSSIFVAFLIGLALSGWLLVDIRGPKTTTTMHLQDVLLTLCIVMLGMAAYFIADTQIDLSRLQIEQAEQLANRKDEALIAAIEGLTKELQRRPAPNPSVVNWALFNLPVKGA